VALVREIVDYHRPFALPEGPDHLLGLTDVRGRGTPMIDLRLKLGLPRAAPTSSTRVLIVDVPLADRVLAAGLVADRVIEVISLMPKEIDAAPDIGVPWRSDYIQGVVRRPSGFVVIFDLARLFTNPEAALLAHVA
jgi:purine-binding chemotaxis protein CheW